MGIRDRFDIDIEDGDVLKAHGNVLDHEYELTREGGVVATVLKKWLRVRNTHGIGIREGEDGSLLLGVTVAIDKMSGHRGPADVFAVTAPAAVSPQVLTGRRRLVS